MRQTRHRDYPPEDSLEIFKNLPKSDFWPYIRQETRSAILSLLDEFRDREPNNFKVNHVREK